MNKGEAEYLAASHATKQVLWHGHRDFSTCFMVRQSGSHCYLTQSRISRTHKHTDKALYFLHDHVESGRPEIKYVPSRENLADIFTKALARPLHEYMLEGFGLLPVKGEC
jgi:hypothetical protein